jgi:type II secretory ATPase GspE/PulE/Tfp pilus assembly ATPase PilB-like protein
VRLDVADCHQTQDAAEMIVVRGRNIDLRMAAIPMV